MKETDVPGVARALAQAFVADPHFSWIVRDERERLQRLDRAFALFIRRIWLPQNEGYTHDRVLGGALWMPPGTWHLSLWSQLLMTPATIRVLREDAWRLLRAVTFIERKHPPTPAHWYLPIIGVASEWQGRGFGAALMRPVLDRCDHERMPAYLEASSPRNRSLYERHGFKVMEECRYASDGPPMWRMWREPAG
jgi:GNAT superfamily N-acetyltransferase